MPSRANIAKYWKDKVFEKFNYIMDWGEPSCWACGKWIGSLDIDLDDLDDDKIFKAWNNHDYLERCHIFPKAHGGCNCEANLVLLCKKCHKDSPDTKNLEIFITWVRNRKSDFHHMSVELKEAIDDLSYNIEKNDVIILFSHEFLDYLFNNAIIVGGKISMSSKIACLIEFKAKGLEFTNRLSQKLKNTDGPY